MAWRLHAIPERGGVFFAALTSVLTMAYNNYVKTRTIFAFLKRRTGICWHRSEFAASAQESTRTKDLVLVTSDFEQKKAKAEKEREACGC